MSVRTTNQDVFDYDDGSIITFYEKLNQFRIDESSDFVQIPALAVLALMFTMFIFHIFASTYILRFTVRVESILSLVSRGFYTIISSTLHYDWEFFYKQSNEKAIVKRWKRHALRRFY